MKRAVWILWGCLALCGWQPAAAQTTADALQQQAVLNQLLLQATGEFSQHQYGPALKTYQELAEKSASTPMQPDAAVGTWQSAYNANIHHLQLSGLEGQARMERYLGDYDASTALYRQALARSPEVSQAAGWHSDMASNRLSVGDLEGSLDEDKLALSLARQASAEVEAQVGSATTAGDYLRGLTGVSNLLSVYFNIAHDLSLLGRWEDLLTVYQTSEFTHLLTLMDPVHLTPGLSQWKLESMAPALTGMSLLDRVRVNNDMAAAYNTLATETGQRRRYRQALTLLQAVTDDAEKVAPALLITIYNNIGFAYDGLHQEQPAIDAYRKALAVMAGHPTNADHELAPWANLLGSYCDTHNMAGAVDAYEHIQALTPHLEEADSRWQVHNLEGRLREAQGQPEPAAAAYRTAIDMIEAQRLRLIDPELRTTYFRTRSGPYQGLLRILQREQHEAEFMAVSERARARLLADEMANATVLKGLGPQLAARAAQQQADEHRLLVAQAEAQAPGASERGTAAPADLSQQVQDNGQALMLEFVHSAPEYAQLHGALSTDAAGAASLLDKDTVMLSYVVAGRDTLCALLRADGHGRVVKLAVSTADLRDMVTRYAAAVRDPERADWKKDGHSLYHLLLGPFERDLMGVRRVVIVPSDKLTYVPFSTLLEPDGTLFIQHYSVVTTPSATVLQFCRQKNSHRLKSVLIYALGRVHGENFAALPGTVHEAEGIHALYPDATVVQEQAFTVDSVQTLAPRYDVLHFATHGVLDVHEPLKSAVITASGPLAVSDIFNLDLHASLVVLSACETSLGRLYAGDELVGLSRSFMYAGTPSVVTTLWSISDRETADLMQSFYRHLRHQDKAEALRQAQLEIIKSHPHPYYWGAFQLLGDWQ